MTECIRCGCTDQVPCVRRGGDRCAWSQISLDGAERLCTFCDEGEPVVGMMPAEDRRIILPGDADFFL